jgi:hypothetical protein
MMPDAPEKSLPFPLRVLRIIALTTVGVFALQYAAKSWQDLGTLTAVHLSALQNNPSYEIEEDGTATYYFGRREPYSISCDGAKAASWNMPGDVDAEMLSRICKKVEAQRKG